VTVCRGHKSAESSSFRNLKLWCAILDIIVEYHNPSCLFAILLEKVLLLFAQHFRPFIPVATTCVERQAGQKVRIYIGLFRNIRQLLERSWSTANRAPTRRAPHLFVDSVAGVPRFVFLIRTPYMTWPVQRFLRELRSAAGHNCHASHLRRPEICTRFANKGSL
jgi:hypothetical protein